MNSNEISEEAKRIAEKRTLNGDDIKQLAETWVTDDYGDDSILQLWQEEAVQLMVDMWLNGFEHGKEQLASDIETYAINCMNRLRAECINVTHPGVQYKIKEIDLTKFL